MRITWVAKIKLSELSFTIKFSTILFQVTQIHQLSYFTIFIVQTFSNEKTCSELGKQRKHFREPDGRIIIISDWYLNILFIPKEIAWFLNMKKLSNSESVCIFYEYRDLHEAREIKMEIWMTLERWIAIAFSTNMEL